MKVDMFRGNCSECGKENVTVVVPHGKDSIEGICFDCLKSKKEQFEKSNS